MKKTISVILVILLLFSSIHIYQASAEANEIAEDDSFIIPSMSEMLKTCNDWAGNDLIRVEQSDNIGIKISANGNDFTRNQDIGMKNIFDLKYLTLRFKGYFNANYFSIRFNSIGYNPVTETPTNGESCLRIFMLHDTYSLNYRCLNQEGVTTISGGVPRWTELQNKEWTIHFELNTDGSLKTVLSLDGKEISSGSIPKSALINCGINTEKVYLSFGFESKDNINSYLEFTGYEQATIRPKLSEMLSTCNTWAESGLLKTEKLENNSGIKISANGSFSGGKYTEYNIGSKLSYNLNDLTLDFHGYLNSNYFSVRFNSKGYNKSTEWGPGGDYCLRIFMLHDTGNVMYRILNQETGMIIEQALFGGIPFWSSLKNAYWSYHFSMNNDGDLNVQLVINGQIIGSGIIPKTMLDENEINPDDAYLSFGFESAENTTGSVDFIGYFSAYDKAEEAIANIGEVTLESVSKIKTARKLYDFVPIQLKSKVKNYSELISAEAAYNELLPKTLNNADVSPKWVPDKYVTVDKNGTPDWVGGLIMAEVRIETCTPEGTFKSAEKILDLYSEMGVNGLWITPISDRKNSNNNGYINLGLHTVYPKLTGTTDYEEGWEEFTKFVDEAHKRNIRIFLDIVSWGVDENVPLLTEHPVFFTGKPDKQWGGIGFNWNNEEFRSWYKKQMIDIAINTGVDGFRLDVEPRYAGASFHKEVRNELLKKGRKISLMSELGTGTDGTYDFQQIGVEFSGGNRQKDCPNWYLDGFANIVDSVKSGSGMSYEGSRQYYVYDVCDHDCLTTAINGNRLAFGYQALFSPFIPLWFMGEEVNGIKSNNENSPYYFNYFDWDALEKISNKQFFEDIKSMIRIRRQYPEIFENFCTDHRRSNICAVPTLGNESLQSYARYFDDTAIVVIGNNNSNKQTTEVTVTLPISDMGMENGSYYTITDLRDGSVIAKGSKSDIFVFTSEIEYENIGIFEVKKDNITIPTSFDLLRTTHICESVSPCIEVSEIPVGIEITANGNSFDEDHNVGFRNVFSLNNLKLYFNGYFDGNIPSIRFQSQGFNEATEWGMNGQNCLRIFVDETFSKIIVRYFDSITQSTVEKVLAENILLSRETMISNNWNYSFSMLPSGDLAVDFSVGDSILCSFEIPNEILAKMNINPNKVFFSIGFENSRTITNNSSLCFIGYDNGVTNFTMHNMLSTVNDWPQNLNVSETDDNSGVIIKALGKGLASEFLAYNIGAKPTFSLDGLTLNFKGYFDANYFSIRFNSKGYNINDLIGEGETNLRIFVHHDYGEVWAVSGSEIKRYKNAPYQNRKKFAENYWSLHFDITQEGNIAFVLSVAGSEYSKGIIPKAMLDNLGIDPQKVFLTLGFESDEGGTALNGAVTIISAVYDVNAKWLPYGDANADGNADILDFIASKNHIIGIKQFNKLQLKFADFNEDKIINAVDIIALKKALFLL